MINCENAIVQLVVFLFFRLNLNKLTILNKRHQDCRIYVRNISGTFQETISDCARTYVWRKVNNAPGNRPKVDQNHAARKAVSPKFPFNVALPNKTGVILHPYLSITATSVQRPLSSVPCTVAFVERLNLIGNKRKIELTWQFIPFTSIQSSAGNWNLPVFWIRVFSVVIIKTVSFCHA